MFGLNRNGAVLEKTYFPSSSESEVFCLVVPLTTLIHKDDNLMTNFCIQVLQACEGHGYRLDQLKKN